MTTDYIIFIHGVNVRDRRAYEIQADRMFQNIKAAVNNPSRTLKPVILFWGDIAADSVITLHDGLESSSKWKEFWFKDLRNEQVLPFVGDAAMYLSRFVSSKIVQQITTQALDQIGLSVEELKNPPKEDRLHLVTHSWGTVIFFDILFASRWEDPEPLVSKDTRNQIEHIRRGFFGIGGSEEEKGYGIPLASIHTMGSPIALFNLVNIQGARSFNFTPKLKELLAALKDRLGKPLLWKNYAHPGDPIAYPLEGLIPLFFAKTQDLVQVEDVMSPTSWIGQAFGQSILSIVNGGTAHGSYWTERKVAQMIGNVIRSTQNQP
ncbi:hypothetical protein [Pseudanabaena sp. PCC 6802]|uniref:hypothetical protein n=1 Tax=Pseudanabaena sp. PCC 6802 TaxID=118173 RepID=UPI00037CE304|nr:hypothetical protein [Pseudanabaena sp. PCC 6802]